MRQIFLYFSISIFSIFLGSQITEGVLLVPYWKSLSASDFYAYYSQFGPAIGQFYTILTVVAALIPVLLSMYCAKFYPKALKYALTSSAFAWLFILAFYVYFKGTNALFYQALLSETELATELIVWNYWHWGRVCIECFSLIFLILSIKKIQNPES